MSIPVKYCAIVMAVDDRQLFDAMHPIMHRNITEGHFSVFGCDCDPPCRELSNDEKQSVFKRWREKPATDES